MWVGNFQTHKSQTDAYIQPIALTGLLKWFVTGPKCFSRQTVSDVAATLSLKLQLS